MLDYTRGIKYSNLPSTGGVFIPHAFIRAVGRRDEARLDLVRSNHPLLAAGELAQSILLGTSASLSDL